MIDDRNVRFFEKNYITTDILRLQQCEHYILNTIYDI